MFIISSLFVDQDSVTEGSYTELSNDYLKFKKQDAQGFVVLVNLLDSKVGKLFSFDSEKQEHGEQGF